MVDEEMRNCSNHGGGAGQIENPKIFVKNNNVGPGVGSQEIKSRRTGAHLRGISTGWVRGFNTGGREKGRRRNHCIFVFGEYF